MDPKIRTTSTQKKSILVTGGAGFIGSHLTETLLAQGHVVYVVDNLITGRKENLQGFRKNPHLHFFKIDITNPIFKRKFATIALDEIYHLACPTGVPNIRILAEEMLLTCSLGTRAVLELAKKKRSQVVISSTAEIYGQPEVFPQHENYHGNVDPIGPRSPYEEGKRFSESLAAMYASKHKLDVKIARIFNTFGPAMSLEDRRVIPQFIRSIKEKRAIVIYGDGSQTRTHLYVEDLVKGLQIIMDRGMTGEAYNVGGTAPLTIRSLAEKFIRLTNQSTTITYIPHFIEDHHARLPSVEKILALGWRQTITLEIGLEKILRHHNILPESRAS